MSRSRPLGVDILEWKKAGRFFRSHEEELKELLAPHEMSFIRTSSKPPLTKKDQVRAFAMIFSAKESVFKTLGAPFFGPHGFRDIEIFPKKNFDVRLKGSLRRFSPNVPLRVSFKKTKHHVVATCHDRSACVGN